MLRQMFCAKHRRQNVGSTEGTREIGCALPPSRSYSPHGAMRCSRAAAAAMASSRRPWPARAGVACGRIGGPPAGHGRGNRKRTASSSPVLICSINPAASKSHPPAASARARTRSSSPKSGIRRRPSHRSARCARSTPMTPAASLPTACSPCASWRATAAPGLGRIPEFELQEVGAECAEHVRRRPVPTRVETRRRYRRDRFAVFSRDFEPMTSCCSARARSIPAGRPAFRSPTSRRDGSSSWWTRASLVLTASPEGRRMVGIPPPIRLDLRATCSPLRRGGRRRAAHGRGDRPVCRCATACSRGSSAAPAPRLLPPFPPPPRAPSPAVLAARLRRGARRAAAPCHRAGRLAGGRSARAGARAPGR